VFCDIASAELRIAGAVTESSCPWSGAGGVHFRGFICMRVRTLLSTVALGVLLASSSVAMAQQPSPPNSTKDQGKKAQNISEDKLNAAAAALANVSRVHQDYQQRLAGASPGDRQHIVDEGNKALAKAVTDKGLSLDEYNAILDVAQNDPDFKAKLIQRAKAVQNQ
jgi:Domain of unknown function (DUF4168)